MLLIIADIFLNCWAKELSDENLIQHTKIDEFNLYYILDDDAKKDARLERYRRYSDEVQPFKVLQLSRNYPEEFKSLIADRISGTPDTKQLSRGATAEHFQEKHRFVVIQGILSLIP